jgi:uncharacterized protein (TIGR02284 family)
MSQQTIISLLEELGGLAILCESGRQALRIAAHNLRDPDLVKLLDSYAACYGGFASVLREEIDHLNGQPRPHPELGETLHKGWLNINAALIIEEGLAAGEVLSVGREALADVVRAYRQALLWPMPADVRSLLEYQYSRSKAMHDELLSQEQSVWAAALEEE